MLLAVCFHAVITSALLLLLLLKVFHALVAALSIYQQLCTFGVSQLPMAMQSRFRTALCAGTKHEACTATEWQQRVQSESGKEELWMRVERNVRGCRLSCSSRSSWLKISAPSRILSVSLCSHRLRPCVVDHLHNTHFQWVIAIHDWAHYLRHTIRLAAGPLTSLNSADYVCMLRCPHSKLGTANI